MSLYNSKDLKSRRVYLRNNMPKPEQVLWYWLRGKNLNGFKFRRQYSVSNLILDFYCPALRLAIEVDGDSHYQLSGQVRDKARDNFLQSQNILK